jgi:UTP:GlnB (protein PII) uridylyltransferase
MFMKTALLLCISALISLPLFAQPMANQTEREINIARKLIDDKRNTAIAFNMSFTQTEKEAFWPLYREYRAAMREVSDQKIALIVEYAANHQNMSQAMARQLLDNHFAAEKRKIKAQEKYVRKFRRILPDIKVTRLMQIENRIDAGVQIKLAEQIPMIE